MKKSKALRSAALVALSAVLVGGVAMAAAGCGGRKENEIIVSMFSSNADKATNQKIADDWAAEYNAANGTDFYVTIANQENKDEYFNKMSDEFSKKTIGDVMYLAPRNVKIYAKSGRVIDLTQYIAGNTQLEANVKDVWPNALNYYGLDMSKPTFPTQSGDMPYTMGSSISYKTAEEAGENGAGFYAEDGNKVGIYGLPKDYSNFSMGYNRVYFTTDMKKAYTTTPVTQARYVKGAAGDKQSLSASNTYTADTGENTDTDTPVIRYAVSGSYTNPVTNETTMVAENEAANIINPGVPVKITPFNFYMWPDYKAALDAGDPIAWMTNWYTGGDGYTVTIPGFPDDDFNIPEGTAVDDHAPYDNTKGHIVYTYAEYGALMWSLTYYLNTFAWDDGQKPLETDSDHPGQGGVKDSSGNYRTVYGGEQYEGGEQDGFQLYVLPWLYSNDADLINLANTYCTSSNGTYNNETLLKAQEIDSGNPENWTNIAGNAADTVKKLRLNGKYEDVQVQYGLNSKNFIETYGAFLAIGSDWNANPNDSPVAEKEGSGWLYFREGRSIFYGAGTWDSAVRNEEKKENVDLGQMPAPVAEKFALYSYIKDANYNMTLYANTTNDMNGTAGTIVKSPTAGSGSPTPPAEVFDKDAIIANQVCRQDKWGARMDSVGYAVTCMSLEGSEPGGAPTAKTAAAASLCAALTISEKPQVALTYGGAQLPNFRSQCEDLLHYNEKDYDNYENGAFKDMITFDGDSEGNKVWDDYYKIAVDMGDAAFNGKGTQTVAEFLAGKTVNGEPVKYDPDFANTKLDPESFARADSTAKSRYSFAMKVLRMVAFRRSDFDLLIRMQYGLNSVRDSSMYTYNDEWLNPHDARAKTENNLCYYRARLITASNRQTLIDNDTIVKYNTYGPYGTVQFMTPFVWCMTQASEAQANLEAANRSETSALVQAGVTA